MANHIVYLNGQYLTKEQARISPLDRGFLFGDGIYEVIPLLNNTLIGFDLHMARLKSGLASIDIQLDWSTKDWRDMLESLIQHNIINNGSIYIQVSRGAETTRQHAFPQAVKPTLFAMCQAAPDAGVGNAVDGRGLRVVSQQDQRWRNCHIKATSLLGNVMHYQHAQNLHADETLLYNAQQQLTEASTCNIFLVKDKCVYTPPLDQQILPGVTRAMTIDILAEHAQIKVVQRPILLSEARAADELWLTSSSKQISAVLELDGHAVGDGRRGELCLLAQQLFDQHKFSY